jgi:hypothetical protein
VNPQLHGATLTRIASDLVLDPRYGPATREVWAGRRSDLLGLATVYQLSGFRVEYSDHEGIAQLIVTLPQGNDPSVSEVPADTWEIITEMDQQSIWNNKRVFSQAVDGVPTIAYWRKRIQNALVGNFQQAGTDPAEFEQYNEGSRDPLTPTEAGFSRTGPEPFLAKLYEKFLRGQDSFEFRRLTLRLTRVISATFAGRAVLDPIEKIYTTLKLQTTFGVPNTVFNLLPADPPASLTPPDTAWSWKLRQDGFQIVLSTNKVQETKDWVFAAWDTDLYELIS